MRHYYGPIFLPQVANAIGDDKPRSSVQMGQAPRHHSTHQRAADVSAGMVENRSFEMSVGVLSPRQQRKYAELTRGGTMQGQSCHKEHPMFRVSAPPKPQTPGPSRPRPSDLARSRLGSMQCQATAALPTL